MVRTTTVRKLGEGELDSPHQDDVKKRIFHNSAVLHARNEVQKRGMKRVSKMNTETVQDA